MRWRGLFISALLALVAIGAFGFSASNYTKSIGPWLASGIGGMFFDRSEPDVQNKVSDVEGGVSTNQSEASANAIADSWLDFPEVQNSTQSQPQVEETTPVVEATSATQSGDPALSELEAQLLKQAAERAQERETYRAQRARLANETVLNQSRYADRDRLSLLRGQSSNTTSPSFSQQLPPLDQESIDPLGTVNARTTGPGFSSSTYPDEPSRWINTHTLAAGTSIPARLTTDIHSELPGLVQAVVTRNVFDSLSMNTVVLPQGTRLIGTYGSDTAPDQRRLFVSWTEARFPNGRIVSLDNSVSIDTNGASGLTGKRRGNFLTAIAQSALIGLAQNAARGGAADSATSDGDLTRAARIATGQATATVTEQYLQRSINRGTRFHIKAGTELNVQLQRSFVIPPIERRGNLNIPDNQRSPTRVGGVKVIPASLAGDKARNGGALRTQAQPTPYNRDDYGGWSDDDGNCLNTRHEVLAALSTAAVQKRQDGCLVLRGRWLDPYSGITFYKAKELDIDHLVPVAWAHYRGASAFDPSEKARFYNDPRNLFAVASNLNRQKGAQPPTEWLPPNEAFHCQYVTRFARIVALYDLKPTTQEAADLTQLRQDVCA